MPFLVWGFFKLITPFIDPITREKLKFNEDMTKYVPREQLWAEWDGDLQFEYDHAEYWPAMNALCEQRRAERRVRWEKGGKMVGELESFLAGGVEVGVAGKMIGDDNVHETVQQQQQQHDVGGLNVKALRIEDGQPVEEKTVNVAGAPAVVPEAPSI